MQTIDFHSSKLRLVFGIDDTKHIYFESMLPTSIPVRPGMTMGEPLTTLGEVYHQPLVEVHIAGDNTERHYRKHNSTFAGKELCYDHHDLSADGKELTLYLKSYRLAATLNLRFVTETVLQAHTSVQNISGDDLTVEYLSSFALFNVDGNNKQSWDKSVSVYLPYNSWCIECQWQELSLAQLGITPAYESPVRYSEALRDPLFKKLNYNNFSYNRISISSTSGQSTGQYQPCAVLRNHALDCSLFFQIEHNGSWQWEVSDYRSHLYLQLAGPTYAEHAWSKTLKPQEAFTSVPVAVGLTAGGLDQALIALNDYRRHIYNPCADLQKLPVIYNDYMNALMGDPTTAREIPLIDTASKIGCEYYCVDCGWYADGWWWDNVGLWEPSQQRFPEGIKHLLDYIRSKGMIPGLWLEIEVMGINCPLAKELPDECFFMRHGKRVISEDRYHLDFRHPQVIAHADAVLKRLVEEYGVGYIKMDYNIYSGEGTEANAQSVGDGLLEHNRAYLKWLEGVFARYPELVIENCGSGGTRMDYAMLKHHSIQSVTDQTDFRIMSNLAAAAATACTPEQAAIWAYPLKDASDEEVITNMVNALLLRVHQSGFLNELPERNLELIKEGLDVYKHIRSDIPHSQPVWPLGLPQLRDAWLSFGLYCPEKNKLYLSVWKKETCEQVKQITLPLNLKASSVRCLYPQSKPCAVELIGDGHACSVELKDMFSARLLEFTLA